MPALPPARPAFALSSTEPALPPALPPAHLRLRPHDRHRPKSREYGPEFLQPGVLHLDRRRRGMVQAMESQLEQQRFEAARLRIFLCTPFVNELMRIPCIVNHFPLYSLCGGNRCLTQTGESSSLDFKGVHHEFLEWRDSNHESNHGGRNSFPERASVFSVAEEAPRFSKGCQPQIS